MLAAIESAEDIGAVGPKILYPQACCRKPDARFGPTEQPK